MRKMIATLISAVMLFAATSVLAVPIPIPSFTIGDKTFSDFTATLTFQGLAGPTSLEDIAITPVFIDATHVGFDIAGSFIAMAIPNDTALQFSTVDLLIKYKCTSAGSAIHDVELSFNGDVLQDPAIASVTETVYADALQQILLGQVSVQTPSPLSSSIILSQDVYTIYVTKDIQLDAWTFYQSGGIVTVSDIRQIISQVPEPGTIVLLGAGLLGLGLLGRRRMKM